MNEVRVGDGTARPSKIVCVGRNYVEHIAELGNEVPDDMVIFVKPNSAISDTLESVRGEPVDYEGEICFLCEGGRFAAVGFGLDLTKRGLQSRLKAKGLPWERAKAFDGAALFSRFVPIADAGGNFSLTLHINGVKAQDGGVGLMIHKPLEILDEIGRFMSLEDGDIVMTGTPRGVGPIRKGDLFAGRVLLDGRELAMAEWVAG